MPFAKCSAAGYVLFCVPKENQKGRRCPQGMKAPVGLLSRRPVCAANAACSARQGLCYFRGAGGGGLRLPASASCLGRHSHPAGRCPNSSSLFRPLAAVVAVALGCFCAVFSDVAAAVRIHPRLWPQRGYIRKTPVYFYTSVFLVGAGGFEPPKLKAADLQSVPIGHSGTRPYSVFAVHGLPVYITTQMVVCQHLLRNFWIFVPKAKTQKQKPPRNQRS